MKFKIYYIEILRGFLYPTLEPFKQYLLLSHEVQNPFCRSLQGLSVPSKLDGGCAEKSLFLCEIGATFHMNTDDFAFKRYIFFCNMYLKISYNDQNTTTSSNTYFI